MSNLHTHFRLETWTNYHHTAGKYFTHGPKTSQGKSVAKPDTALLIILSIVCKYDIKEIHGN